MRRCKNPPVHLYFAAVISFFSIAKLFLRKIIIIIIVTNNKNDTTVFKSRFPNMAFSSTTINICAGKIKIPLAASAFTEGIIIAT